METNTLSQRLHRYTQWKEGVVEKLKAYEQVLKDAELDSVEQEIRIDDMIAKLRDDRIIVAFVAEFSRGKTELINAIFFADYKRRLLPSEAGRTTMCPTELFYDDKSAEAYIRLLPIETRLEETSISEHKQNYDYWTTLPLDISSPEKMADAFKEVVKVKKVNAQEAIKLGLYDERLVEAENQLVEVPMWRHALISFPHPLLKEGLVILDTPGLNALGTEPELTVDMLPNAHAIMFILAADTGVTKSDMEMWEQHVKNFESSGSKSGLMVVLNKIDSLWDELLDDASIDANINSQCSSTAKTLGISSEKVFPVSAHKGLLGKVKQNEELLAKSGIPAIENVLSANILPEKQTIIRERVISEVGSMVHSTLDTIQARRVATREQLGELEGIGTKNEAMTNHLIKTTHAETIAYKVRVDNFHTSRNLLNSKIKEILEYVDIKVLDKVIEDARNEMQGSWTTGGLRKAMELFFSNMMQVMSQVNHIGEQANDIVSSVYKRFHEEYGLAEMKPILFSNQSYLQRMERLLQRAEDYRSSSTMTMTEQSYVIKRFFVSVVSHARDVFFKANEEAKKWSKNALTPIATEIKERKRVLDKRLSNLNRVKDSKETLESKLIELREEEVLLDKQLAELETIEHVICASFDLAEGESET